MWPVLEYACPACHSSLMAAQSKALEAIQRRAMRIIFTDSDYEMALMLVGLDTLESQHARLTERFFRRSVLCEVLSELLAAGQTRLVSDRPSAPRQDI